MDFMDNTDFETKQNTNDDCTDNVYGQKKKQTNKQTSKSTYLEHLHLYAKEKIKTVKNSHKVKVKINSTFLRYDKICLKFGPASKLL